MLLFAGQASHHQMWRLLAGELPRNARYEIFTLFCTLLEDSGKSVGTKTGNLDPPTPSTPFKDVQLSNLNESEKTGITSRALLR